MMDNDKKVLQEDEIDLIELIKVTWLKKWFIAKVASIFIVIGLIIALTSPNEYRASCTLIPEAIESGGKLGGSLSGLAASLAGVDLGGFAQGGSTINPGLYQSVAQSTPFLIELMSQKFFFEEIEKEISVYDYYLDYYRTSLFSKIVSVPFTLLTSFRTNPEEDDGSTETNQSIISLSENQQKVADNLKDRLLVEMDWELNIVNIEVEMQDPRVAAEMTEFARKYITKYVTNYSVSKSNEQLRFIEGQFIQREIEFKEAQSRLATFRDRNINVNSARAKSEEERLQSEYNLAFNIYNQLAQQQESIKLQLNENTPVFTVLEPPSVPNEKSKPKRAIVVAIFLLLGIFTGVLIVLYRYRFN